MSNEDLEWLWMREAVDLGKRSVTEPAKVSAPNVGVVIVRDGVVLASGYRGQHKPGAHAEYCALKTLPDATDLTGATVYTTLEPCSRRSPDKIPCAQRLVDQRVSRVVIGLYDPNPRIHMEGWRILRNAKIELGDFPAELRAEIRADNSSFLDRYRFSVADSDEVVFDHERDTVHVLGSGDAEVVTKWSGGGRGNPDWIYAYGSTNESVCLVRHAKELSDVDDPAAHLFSHVASVGIGQIVVFRAPGGAYAVVKLLDLHFLRGNDDRNEVRFRYELRVPRALQSADRGSEGASS